MANSKTEDYLDEWKYENIICRVLGGPFSNYNGYVALPESHPLSGKHYSDLYDMGVHIDVHGGLTFGGQGNEHSLRWPNPKLWWFGFDTAHSGDYIDYGFGSGIEKQGHKWTAEEVHNEVQKMAEQFFKLSSIVPIKSEEKE